MVIENLSLDLIQSWLIPRQLDTNKGSYGHVLVIGGDYGMPGAPRLAAESAARSGAGLVSVVTRPLHVPIIVSGRPELLCYGLESQPGLLAELIERATVIILGPGLGHSAWSLQLFHQVIASPKPLIIDADGLNILAQYPDLAPRDNWILTPHPGEAGRLLNQTINQVQSDRARAIKSLQQKYGGIIVLKGYQSLVASAQEPMQRCLAGNPGMACAGMGDLLSGFIAGLVAQGLSLWQAAQAGVLLHSTAGDRVAAKQGQRGLLASDLLSELPSLINPA